MNLDRYLTHRKGGKTWWLRVPVPRGLHASYGKREVTRSLKTVDKTEATIRAVRIVDQLRREWDPGRSTEQEPSRTVLDDQTLEATAVRYAYELVLLDFDAKRTSLDATGFEQYFNDREQRLRDRQHEVATGNLASMLYAARGIVAREGWALHESDPRFARFCQYLAEANLAAFKTHAARLRGDIHAVSHDKIVLRVRDREARLAPLGEGLSDLFEHYAQSQLRLGRKRPDTIAQDRKLLKLFGAFVGDERRASSISKKEAREFRDTLFGLPVSLTKRAAYRGLSLKQAVAKAQNDGDRTLDTKTVAKHISTVSPFFDWIVREGHADANPFHGLHPQVSRERPRRPPFTLEQVNTVLCSTLYRGFSADGQEHVPGNLKTRDWRFWIPLLCLFTGARVSGTDPPVAWACSLCASPAALTKSTVSHRAH